MAKLTWDGVGERFYETGVDQGVLYVYNSTQKKYGVGVAWNGLTSVSENPSGAEATPLYADNTKYLNLMSREEFGATIEAYTYPDEFAQCNGEAALGTLALNGIKVAQQERKTFGLAYRTKVGNDVDGSDKGYKIHLIYGCLASPSSKSYTTINDSPEAMTLSWEITTTPIKVEGMKDTSTLVIDSTKFTSTDDKAKLTLLENKLFGTDPTEDPEVPGTDPTLLTPNEIIELLTDTPDIEDDEEDETPEVSG
mgnify:CR=1 FL=1